MADGYTLKCNLCFCFCYMCVCIDEIKVLVKLLDLFVGSYYCKVIIWINNFIPSRNSNPVFSPFNDGDIYSKLFTPAKTLQGLTCDA